MIPPNVSSLRFVLVSFFRSVDLVIKRHAVQNVGTCMGFGCNPCQKKNVQYRTAHFAGVDCVRQKADLYYNRSKLENIPTTLNLKRQYLSTIVRLQLYPCHVFSNSSKWPVQECPSHESLVDNARKSPLNIYTQFVLYIVIIRFHFRRFCKRHSCINSHDFTA